MDSAGYEALKARAEKAEAELTEWRDYWGCESPHDSHAAGSSQLGREQARANRLEAELDKLRRALVESRRIIVESNMQCHGIDCIYCALVRGIDAALAAGAEGKR